MKGNFDLFVSNTANRSCLYTCVAVSQRFNQNKRNPDLIRRKVQTSQKQQTTVITQFKFFTPLALQAVVVVLVVAVAGAVVVVAAASSSVGAGETWHLQKPIFWRDSDLHAEIQCKVQCVSCNLLLESDFVKNQVNYFHSAEPGRTSWQEELSL